MFSITRRGLFFVLSSKAIIMSPSASPVSFPLGYLAADISPRLIAASITILVLSIILSISRICARNLKDVKRGWDDYLLVPAFLLLIGAAATTYYSVSIGGAGRHFAGVIAKDGIKVIVTRTKLIVVLSWMAGLSNAFSRISVVLLYLRIFNTRTSRILSWILLGYLVCFASAQIVVSAVECVPFRYIWTQFEQPGTGKCINVYKFFKANVIFNVVGDVGILLLPIPTAWKLKASWARRAGLAVVFLSGGIGIVASCIRTDFFFRLQEEWSTDPTWSDVSLEMWTIVETGMYFSAACLIGLRPLATEMHKQWKRITMSSPRTSRVIGGSLASGGSGQSVESRPTSMISSNTNEKIVATGSVIRVETEYTVEGKDDLSEEEWQRYNRSTYSRV